MSWYFASFDDFSSELNMSKNSNPRSSRIAKEEEIKEVLNNIDDGIYEVYPNVKGVSDVWKKEHFVLIRNTQTNERVKYAQCTECKGLLSFKDLSGTSHLLRHKCNITDEAEANSAKFKNLNPGKIDEAKETIIQNIIKLCAEEFYSCEDLCDSPRFLDFLQSFVAFTHKYGNVNLNTIYPSGNLIRRNIVNTKEEKLRDILMEYREAKKSGNCSATIEIRKYVCPTVDDFHVLIMSIQYFKNDLSSLKKKIIFATIFDEEDKLEAIQLNIIKNFELFGGDKNDLEDLMIITPRNTVLAKVLAFPFIRNDCTSCVIKDIFNSAIKNSSTVEMEELLSTCRSVVRLIMSNEQYNTMELCQDLGTWKTKDSMLRSIIAKYDDIIVILDDENQDKLRFSKKRAEELFDFLEPFVAAIDDLSATSHTTANKILLWWASLKDHLETKNKFSFEIKNIMINAKVSFDSRFQPTITNKIDCFLDPRYKSLLMLSEAERVEVINEVRKLVADIEIDIDVVTTVSNTHSEIAPQAKKARFAAYEAGTSNAGASKAVVQNKKQDASKEKNRFAKYEVGDTQISDEVSKYVNLPQADPAKFESDLEIITKYWKPRKKLFPKLFKLALSRLHVPASCGCAWDETFKMKEKLKAEAINDLFIVKDNF